MQKRESAVMRRIFQVLFLLTLGVVLSRGTEVRADNNYMTTAEEIAVNKTYEDNLTSSTSGKENWYEFTLDEAGYISLTFNHEFVDTTSSCWKAYLYDANEKTMDYYYYAGYNNIAETGRNIGLPAGTYYLYVKSASKFSSAAYNFQIDFTASEVWEKEWNNYTTTANEVDLDTTYYGSLASSDTEDYYTFSLAEATWITLKFEHEFVDKSSSCWIVCLLDSDEKTLQKLYVAGSTLSYAADTTKLEAGTYYVYVKKGAALSTVDYNFTLSDGREQVDVSTLDISLSKTSYTYNGKARKPSVTVTDGDTVLEKNVDYKISYSNNKKVGTATVKVTGMGDYTGTTKVTFKIVPKGTTISELTAKSKGFTVKVKAQKTQTTGYQIQYSTSSSFKSAKKVNWKVTTSVSKKVTGLKSKKTYYVRVRTYKTVSSKTYYSSWSAKKKVKTK